MVQVDGRTAVHRQADMRMTALRMQEGIFSAGQRKVVLAMFWQFMGLI